MSIISPTTDGASKFQVQIPLYFGGYICRSPISPTKNETSVQQLVSKSIDKKFDFDRRTPRTNSEKHQPKKSIVVAHQPIAVFPELGVFGGRGQSYR